MNGYIPLHHTPADNPVLLINPHAPLVDLLACADQRIRALHKLMNSLSCMTAQTADASDLFQIADIASLYGVECMIGCMIETSISVAAAVHVAAAKANVITKVDLDGPSLGQFNPVEGGVIFNESEITITDAPGLGIREIRGLEMLPG